MNFNMSLKRRVLFYPFLILTVAVLLNGCAAIPISLALEGADAGMSFTSPNSRSFTHSKEEVHRATTEAFNKMQISVTKDKPKGENIKIRGKTEHLKVYVTLAFVTPTVTKASVKVKRNWFAKDQTVAAEILVQINQILRRNDPARQPVGRQGGM